MLGLCPRQSVFTASSHFFCLKISHSLDRTKDFRNTESKEVVKRNKITNLTQHLHFTDEEKQGSERVSDL